MDSKGDIKLFREASGDSKHYDWILEYSTLKPFLLPYLESEDEILMVGCGNSRLSEGLYADGFRKIENTDYSTGVIEMMSRRTAEACPLMTWRVLDMRDMSVYYEARFDVVIDKCAMDAIWSDGGSVWEPSEATVRDITSTVREIHRVLKPGGTFIFVSFGQPHFRKPLLSVIDWEIRTTEIGMFFMYVMVKRV